MSDPCRYLWTDSNDNRPYNEVPRMVSVFGSGKHSSPPLPGGRLFLARLRNSDAHRAYFVWNSLDNKKIPETISPASPTELTLLGLNQTAIIIDAMKLPRGSVKLHRRLIIS